MCFIRISKRKRVDDSDLYYFKDKGSIKLTSKLEALGRTLLSFISPAASCAHHMPPRAEDLAPFS